MQDRYCADVGDFGKYGYLRFLIRSENKALLPLGFVWYRVPDEIHNMDGKYTSYLCDTSVNRRKFQVCDPQLWHSLQQIVKSKCRKVASIREAGLFPSSTIFFEDFLYWSHTDNSKQRRHRRSEWLEKALIATASCNLVLLDPDNGLDTSIGKHTAKGPKYAYYDEVEQFYSRGQSLVIYQHTSRHGSARDQARSRLYNLTRHTGAFNPFAMLYHRGTARLFLVVPQPRHYSELCRISEKITEGPWGCHIEKLGLD